jgi:uncharacterized phage-associated protein
MVNGQGGMNMYSAKYDANDIAKYVINYYQQQHNSISNLKLQKVLYYIQGNFLCKYDKPCFNNTIEAWKHGPVVPDVYFEYNGYTNGPILSVKSSNIILEQDHKEIIDTVLEKCKNSSAWDLVAQTHQESPWLKSYISGVPNIEITNTLIRDYFKSRT